MHNRITIVYDRSSSTRLDKYLVEKNIQELYSRSFIEKLIADDRILVNNIPIKKSYPLEAGDVIEIKLPAPEPKDIVPQDIPLEIVYEDEDIAIINKAPGMIVHPGFGNPDHTLVNAIVYHFGSNLSSGKEINRPGIVHRLDRGTSGLMIIAKNDHVQSLLSDMFAQRKITKTYLAITCGIPNPPADSIETCLARSTSNPRKMAVVDDGKWSLTHYKIIRYYHYFALLKINIETGRMHQIRVHMTHRNYPILGDLLYNSRRYILSIVPENMKRKVNDFITTQMLRQALHAWRLQFVHPITGRAMDIYGDLPEDYVNTIAWLDQHFSIDNERTDINLLRTENTGW